MGVCGTPLDYDLGLMERLEAVYGVRLCSLLAELVKPVPRLYVRVNTLKVDVESYLEKLREQGLRFEMDPDIPEAIWAPVEGPLEVPIYDGKVVVDKRAAEAVLLGSDLYAPGVMAASRVSRGSMVTIVAPNGVVVASGLAVMDGEEMVKAQRGLAVKVLHPRYKAPRVSDLPGFKEGLIYGQSLPSMVAVRILDPKPGEVIVDLTAAPGGKVSHAAQLAGPRSTVIAIDRTSKRGKLEETLGRLGMSWVRVVGGDSRYADRLLPHLKGRVDAVIVDPPCSDLGVRPKLYDRKTLRDIVNLMLYQRRFIEAAARILRKGGRML
ncbi:MAG: RsmB/NOP family class I SAM-dependent RNA methyltransferase, partial [Desulfurococcales archaeon]|nr:RsmB/NOP family class I SAM-dependent RNA methyltransferase [Desulfurococcales archaeon]